MEKELLLKEMDNARKLTADAERLFMKDDVDIDAVILKLHMSHSSLAALLTYFKKQ